MTRTPTLAALWPPSALRARSGDLELRYLDDDLLLHLARLAGDGVHAPDAMPFAVPWSRGPATEVARSVLTYQWRTRAGLAPERWNLELAVIAGGVPVGIQSLAATGFGVRRACATGSWLGSGHQGRGIGKRMRALVLHLAFAGFGAVRAETEAFADNAASNAVSRALGYVENGAGVVEREGAAVREERYVMTRDAWEHLHARHAAILGAPVALDGVAELREFLQIPSPAEEGRQ